MALCSPHWKVYCRGLDKYGTNPDSNHIGDRNPSQLNASFGSSLGSFLGSAFIPWSSPHEPFGSCRCSQNSAQKPPATLEAVKRVA